MKRSEKKKYIFDLDGTLYPFGNEPFDTFGTSRFSIDLKKRVVSYVAQRLSTTIDDAKKIVRRTDIEYNGELSIGFKKSLILIAMSTMRLPGTVHPVNTSPLILT